MSKKEMNFKSLDALHPIVNVINEANEAINDPKRDIANSAIPQVLAGALGAGLGGGLAFAALYGLGTVGLSAVGITTGLATAGAIVGGGMVAGIFVLAAPVAILAGTGVGIANKIRAKQLKQEKDRLYKEALIKHDVIINELKKKESLSQDRIEYLSSLNVLLQTAIKDLKEDLGVV